MRVVRWQEGPPLTDPYAFAALRRQYRACRRNERRTHNALAFEADTEANLLRLQAELRAHTYRPGPSICFVTDGPKPREMFAADFRDRVVHHLLVSWQEPVFERLFIHDSYACRRGKGTLAASDRLMAFLRRETANGRRPAWALHLDVASFFPSIRKAILSELLAARVRHPEARWLTGVVLFHDPTADYRFHARGRGCAPPGAPGYPVPAAKSLFGTRNERGLPIGNLTSQFWANVYLNEVDQFVKRRLGIRRYVRYVDDMVLLDAERARLEDARDAVAAFLRERLALSLRRDRLEPRPVGEGVEFVGWRTWWNRRLPRRRTVGNLATRLDAFERTAVRPGPLRGTRSLVLAGPGPEAAVERLRATVASYAGHLRHGRSWGVWTAVWERHRWLGVLWAREGWRFAPRWERRRIAAVRSPGARYGALAGRLGTVALAFWPAGRFIEFYGPQRLLAERLLGLRRARLRRGWYAFAAGFPVWRWEAYARRALVAGVAVLVVGRRRAGGRRGKTVSVLRIVYDPGARVPPPDPGSAVVA